MRGLLVALVFACAAKASAQWLPELRVEAVRTTATRPELGLGLFRPLGSYVRTGVTVAMDVKADTASGSRYRVEAQVRFLLDPIAESRWGLSFAGGIGVRREPYLMAAAELEGPALSWMRPAIQVAIGAGTRVAFIFRSARTNRR